MTNSAWPDFNVAQWPGTKRTLHMYTQMLGKLRLALSPFQPNWMFTPLYFNARGLTTGFIPWQWSSIEGTLDVLDSKITLARSDGRAAEIALLPARTVAEVFADVTGALEQLGIDCYISPIPQEVPDTTPFNEDRRANEYDPEAVVRWFTVFTAANAVLETCRSHFFGRSGIQFWWGAFDVSLMFFSGKHVAPPTDRGYLMKYDLDAELMNVGLFAGDEKTPPFFYGYIFPQPDDARNLAVKPAEASWSTQLSEWVLPYDAVRSTRDPAAMLTAFVDSIYEHCFDAAGWNRDALTYAVPHRARDARVENRAGRRQESDKEP
ncbi:MAG: hypothetical protein JOZ97_03490 [Candidatus Eremiobacteraeota bacterium]|nr:hypothetical protein [Candidatus Eremiobacteraeota bacterium]